MITIIDLGLGNVNSVSRALTYLRIENVVSADVKEIEKAEKLIFPGVGNFFEASKRMYSTGIAEVIQKEVLENKKPLLGICLGMQLLAKTGEEGGLSDGLGLIDANVSRLKCEKDGYCLPHVGWNDISEHDMKWFFGVEDHSCFYFVHSYEMVLNDSSVEYAASSYGVDFIAVVKKDNVIGAQFHPEKSQQPGLQLLKNFAEGVY